MFWAHGKPEGSKISRLDTWSQVEKSGMRPPELDSRPQLPDECANAWEVFLTLGHGVKAGDIKAYIDLTGNDLDAWEVDGILSLEHWRGVDKPWQQNTQL